MRITWRDGVTTVLAGLTVAIAFAVTQEWGWLLLGSVTAGVGVLALVGLAMCSLSGSTSSPPLSKNPYTVTMSLLGAGALVLIVIGLFTGSEPVFVALAATTLVMWLVSTTAHVIAGSRGAPVRPASAA